MVYVSLGFEVVNTASGDYLTNSTKKYLVTYIYKVVYLNTHFIPGLQRIW